MSYHEEKRQVTCPKCGTLNHIIIAYAGDSRGNEREDADCYSCNAVIDREKCFAIYTADTEAEALLQLRKMQNRA